MTLGKKRGFSGHRRLPPPAARLLEKVFPVLRAMNGDGWNKECQWDDVKHRTDEFRK